MNIKRKLKTIAGIELTSRQHLIFEVCWAAVFVPLLYWFSWFMMGGDAETGRRWDWLPPWVVLATMVSAIYLVIRYFTFRGYEKRRKHRDESRPVS